MENKSGPEQQAVVATVIGLIVSVALSGGGASIWYLPLSAILVMALLAHWNAREKRRLHRLTYAFVLSFALLPGVSWILSPVQPVVLDGPTLTWWNIRDLELELFLLWCLFAGAVYVARRSS